MIILLGATGYVGQAFARELDARQWPYIPLSRKQVDYTRFEVMLEFLRARKPDFVINAAGFTGKPNVDACETAWADTLQGNTLFPQALAAACMASGVPLGHVSSGCIYSGAKINGRAERDLMAPAVRSLWENDPSVISGYLETDEPNFTFRRPPCSFYSGTKALAEEAISGMPHVFTWRLRIPFDEVDNSRNYLSKVQRYPKVYVNVNAISHREDYVRACLDLWARRAPFGIYNITNPGWVTTRQVVESVEEILRPGRSFEYWTDDAEFYKTAAKTPRSNCVLDTGKLLAAGVRIRPVQEAIEDSLRRWKPEI
jgi:dTDP-4-dehydrorhamnose reductase